MVTLPQVEGLTAITGPMSAVQSIGNKFALPSSFDFNKWASKWELDGTGVLEAQQDEILVHTNQKAAGWTVWNGPDKKPYTRVVGKQKHILMFRPKALQQAVNTIYGNQSRSLVQGELSGQTNHAMEMEDAGILTNADLRRFEKATGEDEQPGYLRGVLAIPRPNEANEITVQ